MKVNFILPGLGDSGGTRVVKKYAKLFNEMGIDTVIYCSLLANNLHRYSSKIKNRVHQIYCTFKTVSTSLGSTEEVKWVPCINGKYIREADFTIATMWATAYEVVKLPKTRGEKIYFVQGYEIWDNRELGQKSYALPLRKIVISTWINRQLKKDLSIGPFPIVYNGIDHKTYNCSGRMEHSGINLLMMNHTLEKKGVEQGLEVFKRIRDRYPDVSFKMFGKCSNKNLPGYIEYYCDPDEKTLVHLYKEADIFIFPSLEEGWGLTPLEAMACGCIVVGANTGFVLDLGRHGVNMMISEPGDVNQMEYDIINLIKNVNLRLKIAVAGNQVAENLDWKDSASIFIDHLLRSSNVYE